VQTVQVSGDTPEVTFTLSLTSAHAHPPVYGVRGYR